MDTTPRLALPYLQSNQAQKHVTVNDSLGRLDALVQLAIRSRTTVTEPAFPDEGDAYLLPAGATGAAWTGLAEGTLAHFIDGAWQVLPVPEGLVAFVADEEVVSVRGAAGWTDLMSAGDGGTTLPALGVNTAPDPVNRLAVKSDAVLVSHDDVTPGSGDVRITLNKLAAGQTASFVFQTAYSGRAEFGLTGSDRFELKASSDGMQWTTMLLADAATGAVSVPDLVVEAPGGDGAISFADAAGAAFWKVGQQGDDNSFYIKRPGGFGTGGKVFILDADGNLGLWGLPSPNGLISITQNINSRGVTNLLYLEQTAQSVAGGVAHFRNASENATPLLTCSAGTRTPLKVPAAGAIELGSPLRLASYAMAELPSAGFAGVGAMVLVSDAPGGAAPCWSDGTAWRRLADNTLV